MSPNALASPPVPTASLDVLCAARSRIMRGGPLYVRRAQPKDLDAITGMIDDAKVRLRELGTDQWSTDWADRQGRKRRDRVEHSLAEGKTWLAEFIYEHPVHPAVLPVATVTIERTANPAVWTDSPVTDEPAVYLGRLVTAEGFGGLHIGSRMLDWAGRHGADRYGAQWIRIDVWTTNTALHEYYVKRDFEDAGLVPDQSYPSQKLFQRPARYESGTAITIYEVDTPGNDTDC
ncbi:MAG TPA: GNAT family N-acetyltransferase [Streptosporangiaceae bacterium]|jgi:ribosomal protein S18 acetylase RimI-like enzyme